jgi:60 kDa SS-A/Ro ribonucleoprotein
MANKNLFRSLAGKLAPEADAVNEAGGKAYALSPEHALAQYAATGCLSGTYYASAGEQLEKVLALASRIRPELVAKTAVYCRERGQMKDTPALLVAVLAVRAPALFAQVFPRVIDNARMLRTFVQVLRSGKAGRKSFGSRPRRLVQDWLAQRSDAALFKDSAGQSPSLADIVKMVHPKPATEQRRALYGYLIGRAHDVERLPALVRDFEAFKAGATLEVPQVPFQMLTGLPISREDWKEIARSAPWQMTRMNLNTFARHGVFESAELVDRVAARLRDPRAIRRARAFPYQLLAAFNATGEDLPGAIRDALQDAMETAIENVPAIEGRVFVCPDVSGSMQSPVTGSRKGATTAMRCVDVAALLAAALVRKNPTAKVLPFEQEVVNVSLNPRDSVMTQAQRLASVGGGGTNCSAPLSMLNGQRALGDLVVFVSDNESWVDASARRGTATMREWDAFKARNPRARLVCIDLQPYGTTQAKERDDVLNVGGFADPVFDLVAEFAKGTLGGDHWLGVIEEVEL